MRYNKTTGEMLDRSSHISPFDALVSSHIANLSSPKDGTYSISNLAGHDGGSFLKICDIDIESHLKRNDIDQAIQDFKVAYEKILQTYNNIPQIRPYLQRFPLKTGDIDVWLRYTLDGKRPYLPPYFSLVNLPKLGENIEFRKYDSHFVALNGS
ncbi:MAG: hypothetical protein QRY74_00305 [Chlamydia sp.]